MYLVPGGTWSGGWGVPGLGVYPVPGGCTVAFLGSTNPCRITRKVEQTKMYLCTLEEFILVDIWIHCCTSWN